jgi:hypothetical protein
MLKPLCLASLLALVAPAAFANVLDCGENAISSASVVEGKPSGRGPIVSVPRSLCADLVEDRRREIDLSATMGTPTPGAQPAPSTAAPRKRSQPRF